MNSPSVKSSWSLKVPDKLVPPEELGKVVAALRERGESIATLNGSFDLLHAGHLHIIYEASLQADRLIVALNTDASIQRYKSSKRPIVPLKQRLEMIAALGFVDYVTWFDETDPRTLLDTIRPDVHVNGADYGGESIEAPIVKQHGGRLHLVPIIPGLSTSNLIQRIREVCD
jgi:D-glycero-beta-D-manno-heptose 1-phosphate adenylyltransferase